MFPKIRQGAIVRSRKNTLFTQEDDFLAVSDSNNRFHISEKLADLLKITDGTLSMDAINKLIGYDCKDVFKSLFNYEIIEFDKVPSLNQNHKKQFLEVTLKLACQTVVWHTTRKCNLKCGHCYYLYEKEAKEDFSTGEIETICKSLTDLGCEMIILSGGEILSNKKTFNAITDRLDDLCLPFRINTNGTFNSNEILKVFHKSKYAKLVQISLDGREDIHDKLRGVKGSYKKAIESLKIFKENGIYIRIVSMLTNEWINGNDVLGFARILSELKVDQWIIEVPSITGRWNNVIEDVYIPNLTIFAKKLIEYSTNCTHNFKIISFNQVFNYPSKYYMSKSLDDKICSHDLGLLSFGAEGVSYCTLFREQFGKDWKDFENPTHLLNAWDKISSFRLTKQLKDNLTCKNCELFSICQGGCPGQYSNSKDFQGCDYHSKMLALVKNNLINEGYDTSKVSIN